MKLPGKFMRLIMPAVFVVLHSCDTPPSPDSKTFLKYFGQDGNQTCVDLEVDTDGSFYMLGNNRATLDEPKGGGLFLIRVDPNGNLVWKRTILPNSSAEGLDAKDIELLSDGSIVILADYYKDVNDHDLFVARFTRDNGAERDRAVIQATPIIDDPTLTSPQDEIGTSITEVRLGARKGFIIAGSANNLASAPKIAGGPNTYHERDGIHVRLDENLAQLSIDVWKDVQGAGNVNYETKVIEVAEEVFFSFGYASRPDGSADINFVVVKLKESGQPLTMLDPGGVLGTPNNMERLGSVCVASGSSNTYFLSGISSGVQNSLFVAEVVQLNDPSDGILLQPVIVPNQPAYDLRYPDGFFTSSSISSSGGFLVATNEFLTGHSQILLAKIGSDGSGVWGAHPPSFGSDDVDLNGVLRNAAGAVRELPDGRIIVAGTISLNNETKMALMKLNKDGHFSE